MIKNRGFHTISPEQHRQISSAGGKAGHALKKAHEWTSEEARAAGQKGGIASAAKRKAKAMPPLVCECGWSGAKSACRVSMLDVLRCPSCNAEMKDEVANG